MQQQELPDGTVEAVLRDAHLDDAAAVLALNNACAPGLTSVDLERMRWFYENCPYFRVVVVDERKTPRGEDRPAGAAEQPLRERREPESGPPIEKRPEHSNLAGFLVAMPPDCEYDSGNFRWFRERGDDFVYIDRIAVSSWFRRRGIAARLYADIENFAREQGASRLTCEVNVRPLNEASLAFHERMGFEPLEERETEYGLRVVMLEKRL